MLYLLLVTNYLRHVSQLITTSYHVTTLQHYKINLRGREPQPGLHGGSSESV